MSILPFIFRRLVLGIFSIVLVVVIVCSLIFLVPVDPARMSFGQRLENKALEQKREQLGLDDPLIVQLGLYLRDISPLEVLQAQDPRISDLDYCALIEGKEQSLILKAPYLRESYQTGRSVWALLSEAIPLTILLTLASMILAMIIGVGLGILAAHYRGHWIDHGIIGVSTLGYSIPSYVSALIFALIFGFLLRPWTGLHLQGSLFELNDLGQQVTMWKNLLLPALALGIRPIAVITQITRSSMIEVLGQNYIKTAFAKGLSRFKVYYKHALINAANPITTTITGWFAALLSGAFFVESVFNFRGLGHLTVTALLNYDLPIVLGAIIVTSTAFVALNILTDLIHMKLNPRLRDSVY